MNLLELIQRLAAGEFGADDDRAIYASPRWSPSSPAVVVEEPRDGSLPLQAAKMTYLTSVIDAHRVISARVASRPTVEAGELAEAVIYFAIYDETEPLPSIRGVEFRLPVAV